jgi:hypothetical protein
MKSRAVIISLSWSLLAWQSFEDASFSTIQNLFSLALLKRQQSLESGSLVSMTLASPMMRPTRSHSVFLPAPSEP